MGSESQSYGECALGETNTLSYPNIIFEDFHCSKQKHKKENIMTRDEAIKSLYCRGDMTKEDIVNKIYDAHEAKLTKACEILEGANLVEIERHFAECKAKDEEIKRLKTVIYNF